MIAKLTCRCGGVRGRIADAAPGSANRVVCYCADCQAFAHHLGRADLLDAHGGSDIVQVAPCRLTFESGTEHIAGLRLSPKGLLRWYASCCNTPLGNMVSPAVPFVGIIAQALPNVDDWAGKPRGAIYGRFAVGEPPPGSTGLNLRLLLGVLGKVATWKLTGKAWPHPFFDGATAEPIYPIAVLSEPQREAVRPLCGPRHA